MTYISKEKLLKAIGEEPIVENENDEVQIAMVLQYRKFVDIINNLPTYVFEVIPNGKNYVYDPVYAYQKSTGLKMCFDRWREVEKRSLESLMNIQKDISLKENKYV